MGLISKQELLLKAAKRVLDHPHAEWVDYSTYTLVPLIREAVRQDTILQLLSTEELSIMNEILAKQQQVGLTSDPPLI